MEKIIKVTKSEDKVLENAKSILKKYGYEYLVYPKGSKPTGKFYTLNFKGGK